MKSDGLQKVILRLYEQGLSSRQISNQLVGQVSKTTINDWVKMCREFADENGGIHRKTKFPQGVMVWLGVCYDGVTRPVIIENGTINHQSVDYPTNSYYSPPSGESFLCSNIKSKGMTKCSDIPKLTQNNMTCTARFNFTVYSLSDQCVNWNQYYRLCKPSDTNPYNGGISFDNVLYAFITIFQKTPDRRPSVPRIQINSDDNNDDNLSYYSAFEHDLSPDVPDLIKDVRSSTQKIQSFVSSQNSVRKKNANEKAIANTKNMRPGRYKLFNLKLNRFIETNFFIGAIFVCICLNTLCLSIEYHGQPHLMTQILEYINFGFAVIFLLEMILKLIAMGMFQYIKDPANIFDGLIAIISLTEIYQSNISALRAFRMLRIFRLISFLPGIKRQIAIMVKTINDVAVFFLFLMLFIFMFGVLGSHLFGGHFSAVSGYSVDNRTNIEIKCHCCQCKEFEFYRNQSNIIGDIQVMRSSIKNASHIKINVFFSAPTLLSV
ncbi:unnamed protein product [Didymodactylos carnosus]|uniref:Ion transport domain-containing protein n=1 Tax=Didymodactylos carnosus TaxID=1234261 RepID=A0A8S2EIG7_9BILA|nr:unnamed protein product [Didymodactylos carnosus]CAF3993226.1 unnamed protein product [Didymodactylos carnosus]